MTGIEEVAAGFSREWRVGPRAGGSEEVRKLRGHLGKGARHREQPAQASAGAATQGSGALGRRTVLGWRMGDTIRM